MKTALRIFLSFISFIATYYIVFWIPFSLLPGAENRTNTWLPSVVSFLVALGIAFFIWKKTSGFSDSLAITVLKGGIIVGAICFALGFFGPIVFNYGGGQGPLLGFVAAPLGFILGLFGGGIYCLLKKRNRLCVEK